MDELNAKYTERKTGPSQPATLDERAQQMFIDYANELTIAVLEASSLLAQHRGSKTIDVEDVSMILSKCTCGLVRSLCSSVTIIWSFLVQTRSWG